MVNFKNLNHKYSQFDYEFSGIFSNFRRKKTDQSKLMQIDSQQ